MCACQRRQPERAAVGRFFYLADFAFVCPTELGDLADRYDTFKALGVEIYAISRDARFAHKAWHDSSDTISKITCAGALF